VTKIASDVSKERLTNGFAATAAGRVAELVQAGIAAARDESASPAERAEMLMELAMGLQLRPKTPDHFQAAIGLYGRALQICPPDQPLLAARIRARKATALQAVPDPSLTLIEEARQAYEQAIPCLERFGGAEELAEAEMNRGLVLQQLATSGRARMADSIAAYQRALRTFDAKRFPVEFAILQNNLATAFLSLPFTDERAKMREALAVQCFEDALKVITLIDHPVEYGMLQNNLGNALQHASTSHVVENRLRALAAYDEALKVRTRATTPLEYANTIANKANCLCGLPEEPDGANLDDSANLRRAREHYEEAHEIFRSHGEIEKAEMIAEAIADLDGNLEPESA
jgi:tetratricopeptide (TPR) repeat protein